MFRCVNLGRPSMFKSSPAYGIWSIWKYLWIPSKLLFLWLCVLGIYSLFFAIVSTRPLRAISHLLPNEGTASGQRAVTALHKRCTMLRQLTRATFYLFGFVLFLCFQWAYMTVDKNTATGEWFILENF